MGASNNWAISGNHTKSGKPILSNDPHLGNGIPSIWHICSFSWRDEEGRARYISGAAMPGVGMFVSAKNEKLAWALTILTGDQTDLYYEKIEGDKYLYDGEWKDLIKRKEIIEVKGE